MRHTVVLSDIHLCEVERTDGLWMRYRQAAVAPDRDLAEMLLTLSREIRGDSLELVLNGDIFDFDAPRVIDGVSVFHDEPRDAEHATPQIKAILGDHPVFVEALGRLLAEGHRIVLVSGNHDAQLTLPEVREAVRAILVQAARAQGGTDDAGAAERVAFRSWFYVNEDGAVFEHGHQHDDLCSFRYPMAPFLTGTRTIKPTLGSLAARHFLARMGYFNPHVDSSFMLSAPGYVGHWFEHYLFTGRSLALPWIAGTARSVLEILKHRDPGDRDRRRAHHEEAANETGVSRLRAARHLAISSAPAESRFGRIARELWLDRIAAGGATAALAAAFVFAPRGALGAVATLAPLAFLGYELAKPKPTLEDMWARVARTARDVARVHDAPAVVLGHTHKALGVRENGVFYGNSGSWSPAFRDLACTDPVSDERPVIWLTAARRGDVGGGLTTWRGGRFHAASGAIATRLSDCAALTPEPIYA